MRPIYGCRENFRESLSTPTATLPKFLMGFCSDRSHECAYKIWSLYGFTIPEIIRVFKKIWTVPGYAHALFSRKFFMGFFWDGPLNVTAKFAVRSFTRSWDNSDFIFGLGLRTPNLVEGKAVGGRWWHRSNERWWVHIGTPLFIYLYAFSVLQHPLFPTPPLVSPKLW